jgi:hypothetical protein
MFINPQRGVYAVNVLYGEKGPMKDTTVEPVILPEDLTKWQVLESAPQDGHDLRNKFWRPGLQFFPTEGPSFIQENPTSRKTGEKWGTQSFGISIGRKSLIFPIKNPNPTKTA